MTPPIKLKLAGQKFTAATYQALFKLADEAWLANGGSVNTPAVVAAIEESPSNAAHPPTTSHAQVGAINQRGQGRGRGRGGRNNRGGRGGGRGANNSSYNNNQNQGQNQDTSSKSHQKGPKHPDLPSSASWACAQHWKKGRGAPYCSDPLVCQWVRIVAPRQPSSTNTN